MNKEKRNAIYSTLRNLMPEPTTELIYHSPFELLVAVILSAQATDVSVNKATERLFAVANTPALDWGPNWLAVGCRRSHTVGTEPL